MLWPFIQVLLLFFDQRRPVEFGDDVGEHRHEVLAMPGANGKPVRSEVGTQALWDLYPQHVRKWISARGGLSSKMMFLRGSELFAMYPECRGNEWVN